MRRYWYALSLLVILVLSACQASGTSQSAATSAVTAEPEQTVAVTEEATVEATNEPVAAGTVAPQATAAAPSCRPFSLIDQVLGTPDAALPPVSDSDWQTGSDTPVVTLIVYSDFQCPYCSLLDPQVNTLLAAYPEDVKVVFRSFPLMQIHPNAAMASQAAEAAGLQGKFFEMGNFLFSNQSTWSELAGDAFVQWLKENAATAIQLDAAKFATDLTSEAVANKVQQDYQNAVTLGLSGTPSIFINGTKYEQNWSAEILEMIVDLVKFKDKQYTECPPMVVDASKEYFATVKTSKGDFVLQLFPDKAPLAVNSFVFLAQEGWFDDTPFHRVLADFVAQGGDPTGSGAGGPGYAFSNEPNDLMFDKEGVVGMANSGTDTNGSQFFITYSAQPDLDGGYTVFGQVVSGMDIVKLLTPRDPSSTEPLPEPDTILSVTIEEK